jgi:hypothetical protein
MKILLDLFGPAAKSEMLSKLLILIGVPDGI